jgi:superfamily II DNA or RNA helicase
MPKRLHDYQQRAIDQLREALASGAKRPLLMAPTGAGKTVIASTIIRSAADRGKRVYFTVPAVDLVDQTFNSFFREGIYDMGVIQANHPQTNHARPVQIISIDTLARREVAPPDICIVDEAHRRNKGLSARMRDPAWAKTIWIGLSATPWSKGLGQDYDRLIIATTTQELIERGYLSPFRVFAPVHPDLSNVKVVAGEYQQDQLSAAMQAGGLVGDIVTTWLELWGKDKTLCFGVDCAHAMAIQRSFEAAGISCGYQDANTPREERKAIARKFASGELRVVANVGTLTTGVDWDVRCLVLARPTKSEMLYVQIIGRALRTAPGKESALILDHSDTTLRLGFVTDIHHDILDDGRPKPKAAKDRDQRDPKSPPLPKECKSCHALKPARVLTCPACGFTPRPEDTVEAVDGELREFSRKKTIKTERNTQIERDFYAQLLTYQREHFYKPGWAAINFKKRFGDWPRDMKTVEPADTIEAATSAWIRGQTKKYMIARAKAQASANA